MGTLGPNRPTVLADDASIGTIALSNVGNAIVSDDAYVTATLLLGQISHYLKATGFQFSIPMDATVTGILVEVERSATLTLSATDSSIKLVKAGSIGGTDKATGTNWPASDSVASYGGDGDLWGQGWTPSDINASTFGVAVAAVALAGVSVQIDQVRITVYYAGSSRASSQAGNKRINAGGMFQSDFIS